MAVSNPTVESIIRATLETDILEVNALILEVLREFRISKVGFKNAFSMSNVFNFEMIIIVLFSNYI